MDEKLKMTILAIVIALSGIMISVLFEASGLRGLNPVSFSIFDSLGSLAGNPAFFALLFISPVPFATIALTAFLFEKKKNVYIIGLVGACIAIIFHLVMIAISIEEIILLLFMLLSVVVVIEGVRFKKEEEMKLPTFRISSGAAKKAFLLVGVGLFLATAYNATQNQEENTQKFGDMLMEIATTQQSENNSPMESIADLLIDNQQQLTATIIEMQSFQNMKEKDDSDVQSFVLSMNALQKKLGDPETKENILKQFEENQSQNQQLFSFDYLRNVSPAIDTIAKNYWLILAFSTTMLFLFFVNVILGNMVGFYTAFFRKAGESIRKEPETPKSIEVIKE